jgi:hypothetical protein
MTLFSARGARDLTRLDALRRLLAIADDEEQNDEEKTLSRMRSEVLRSDDRIHADPASRCAR